MDLYPAIDIEGGRVVRAGRPRTGAAADPVAQAEAYVAQGAHWLHVVDLDRAFGTGRDNDAWVRRICGLDGVRVQVGGNVADPEWARAAVEAGAARVVLGTAAALEPALLARLLGAVGRERAALAVDVRAGRVALRGRETPVRATPAALAERALAYGVPVVVHRDLLRDGLLRGADVDGAAALVQDGLAVVAAGGVGALDELRTARRRGLAGVIVGRALHEGRFSLAQAIVCCR